MDASNVTLDFIKSILNYDPETGVFTWKCKLNRNMVIGEAAGSIHKESRYVEIQFYKLRVSAHRLAWFYINGNWPNKIIDHINGDPSDNRIANLRDVSCKINSQNLRKAKTGSYSGLLGVSYTKKRGNYKATICVDGKHKHLGTYNTPEEAHERYLIAKREYHEGCVI